VNESTTKVRSQLISERKSHFESQRELEAEIKSLKYSIKTLKRKATLAQKASSLDKTTILSLETK
ncbi:10300_t:CDS:1, partial [Gigaspora rosea]